MTTTIHYEIVSSLAHARWNVYVNGELRFCVIRGHLTRSWYVRAPNDTFHRCKGKADAERWIKDSIMSTILAQADLLH